MVDMYPERVRDILGKDARRASASTIPGSSTRGRTSTRGSARDPADAAHRLSGERGAALRDLGSCRRARSSSGSAAGSPATATRAPA